MYKMKDWKENNKSFPELQKDPNHPFWDIFGDLERLLYEMDENSRED